MTTERKIDEIAQELHETAYKLQGLSGLFESETTDSRSLSPETADGIALLLSQLSNDVDERAESLELHRCSDAK